MSHKHNIIGATVLAKKGYDCMVTAEGDLVIAHVEEDLGEDFEATAATGKKPTASELAKRRLYAKKNKLKLKKQAAIRKNKPKDPKRKLAAKKAAITRAKRY